MTRTDRSRGSGSGKRLGALAAGVFTAATLSAAPGVPWTDALMRDAAAQTHGGSHHDGGAHGGGGRGAGKAQGRGKGQRNRYGRTMDDAAHHDTHHALEDNVLRRGGRGDSDVRGHGKEFDDKHADGHEEDDHGDDHEQGGGHESGSHESG